MGALRRIFTMCCILVFEAVAILAPGSAFAFAGNLTAPGIAVMDGIARYAGEARFVSSVMKTSAISAAAGRSLVVESAWTMARGAGPAIIGACFANILACGTIASIVAWMASGDYGVEPDGDIVKYVPGMGVYWTHAHSATQYMSASDAAEGLVQWANSVQSQDDYSVHHLYADNPLSQRVYVMQCHRINGTCIGPYQFESVLGTEGQTRVPQPAVQTEVEQWAENATPTDDAANDAKTGGVPIPVENPKIGPDGMGQWVPDPGAGTYPCPTEASPNRTCQDGYVVTSTADTTGNPTSTNHQSATKTSDDTTDPGAQPEPETKTQCELFPNSVGCVDFGEDPGGDIPKKTVNVSYAAEWLGLPAGCPAPMVVNGNSISYQSACDAMNLIRPFVISLAAVGAMLTALAVIRSSS